MIFFPFLFTFFTLSLGSKCSSNPEFPGAASWGLFLGAALDPLGTEAVPRPYANTGRSSKIIPESAPDLSPPPTR